VRIESSASRRPKSLSFASAISGSIAEISAASREIVREFSEIDFRRSALRQKPVVIVGNQYIRPIEQLLTWRITSGLYYDVIGDSRSANEIGSQYEKYTRELFRAFVKNRKVDGDFRYGTRQRSQRAPDCIVHDNGAVQVIVECKAKKLPLVAQTAMIETRERAIAVGEIANGVAQVRLFRQALLNGVVPDFHLAESATLIVVTLDDWVFVGADIKDDIFKQAREISLAKGLNAETIGDCDVVLCTAAELDRLTSRYSYDTLRLICDRNLEEKYKNYPLTGVANECFKEKRHQAEYPLQAKLDKLIGIGVDEQGQEFLLDDAGEKCSPY
jgi:hypothetical protein